MAKLNILLPVDFAQESEVAYRMIERIAENNEVSVTLIHIFQAPLMPPNHAMAAEYYTQFYQEQKDAHLKRLQEISELPYFEKCGVVERIENETSSNIGAEIGNYASEHGYDLVVASSKHRSGFEEFMVGTELLRILRYSRAPVLCLTEGHLPTIRRIMFATDFSSDSTETFLRVMNVASVFDASIYLTGVNTQSDFYTSREVKAQSQRFIDLVADKNPEVFQRIEEVVNYNDRNVADGVTNAAEDYMIDLIAVATHGRKGLARFIDGSVTEQIIRNTRFPVLVCKIAEN